MYPPSFISFDRLHVGYGINFGVGSNSTPNKKQHLSDTKRAIMNLLFPTLGFACKAGCIYDAENTLREPI